MRKGTGKHGTGGDRTWRDQRGQDACQEDASSAYMRRCNKINMEGPKG